MLRNISLGSNGVDWVCSFREIPTWLCGTNFCINCTSSPRFAPSFMQLWNDPKCTQTLWNTPKLEFRIRWGGSGAFVAKKLQRDLMARTFAFIAPVQYVLQQVSRCYETIPNAPKYYETDRYISFGSNGVDLVHSLWKILTWLRGTNFCINCTSSPCFASSLRQLWNDPKCTKHYATHQNMSLESNGADWVRSLWKLPIWIYGTNFCINCTSSPRFASSLMQLWNDPKCTKHYATHQNMSLGSNGVD